METSEVEEKVVNKITKEDLFFKKSLYEKINISDLEPDIFSGEVDGFSPNNKIETTYIVSINTNYCIIENKIYDSGYYHSEEINGIYKIELSCKRKDEELSFFIKINNDNGYIEKIGQYPSVADMILSKIDEKYSKILKKEWSNYTKAIGLFAHGIGIGSFVYLRRIFEELIFETFHKNNIGLPETEFKKLHMDEKVLHLKDFLPNFLVTHRKVYSIISKGIHELDEDTCKKYFPIIQKSIELILDQKIEIIENEEKEKKISNDLHDILSEIS